MTLAAKIDLFESSSNEVAMYYNDSGDFWCFRWGPRGCSVMVEYGETYCALEAETFEDALTECLTHRGLLPAEVPAHIMSGG